MYLHDELREYFSLFYVKTKNSLNFIKQYKLDKNINCTYISTAEYQIINDYFLKALADIEVAIKVLNKKSSIENPIDRAYQQLECDLKPLDVNDNNYKLISDYLFKTHAATHNTYKVKILDIFDVHKQLEHDRFKDVGNKMLLWHGSRTSNWAGILNQGLRIAPPEAPSTGYMVLIASKENLIHSNPFILNLVWKRLLFCRYFK